MKKLTKTLLMLAVAVTVIFASSSIAMAANSGYLTMEKPTSTTEVDITVDLTNYMPKYITATSLTVTKWEIVDFNTGEIITTGYTPYYETTLTRSPGYAGQVKLVVYYDYTSSSGYSYSSSSNEYYYLNSKPATISKKNIGCYLYSSIGKMYFQGAKDNYATGVQYKLYKMSSGKCVKTISNKYTMTDSFGISNNVAYKYKARQYYTNPDTGETYYGSWSGYRYVMNPTCIKGTRNYSTGKVTIKVTGKSKVTGYEIRVSDTLNDGSGTLKKTLKPGVGKTASYTLKTSKDYIKVIPILSGGHKSDYLTYFNN